MITGIDDTDSLTGMCTTYLATKLAKKLKIRQTPKLIRLNPNIPYKTRGNGAVSFTTKKDEKTKQEIKKYVEKYAKLDDPKTNPGIAFVPHLTGNKKKTLTKFYHKTLSQLVSIEEAENVAASVGAKLVKFKNGRGVIGALAACGAYLSDKTYELIAYRVKENYGSERRIDAKSVFRMNEKLYPRCFDSVDLAEKQVLITPRGYDPIFCGIRGESESIVKTAWDMITPLEDIECTQVFVTNQATDVHVVTKNIVDVCQYDCVIITGAVSEKPKCSSGGHVFFDLMDKSGSISCAAFRQTAAFREVISSLIPDDQVTVYGGVGKYKDTVNIEKIKLDKLSEKISYTNPLCHGRSMSSVGKDKGFKCRVCGKKNFEGKIRVLEPRKIVEGFYEPPASARRHLSKPLTRFNQKR